MKPTQCTSSNTALSNKAAIAVIAIALSTNYILTATAFTTPDHQTQLTSTFSAHYPTLLPALFASPLNGDKKLIIELVDDTNRETLLNPPDKRPVLVDAFAPFCGPCKLLDKVLKKAQPNYLGRVDFCRWNVSDKESTSELKTMFIEKGYTLTKLPSLIVFREGEPVAVRPGFANEFQLDDWLERTLPDVLERTFDENGIKMVPSPVGMMETAGDNDTTTAEEENNEQLTEILTQVKASTVSVSFPSPLGLKARFVTERLRVTSSQRPSHKVNTEVLEDDCMDEEECFARLEETFGWQNRTVVPASEGILMPRKSGKVALEA